MFKGGGPKLVHELSKEDLLSSSRFNIEIELQQASGLNLVKHYYRTEGLIKRYIYIRKKKIINIQIPCKVQFECSFTVLSLKNLHQHY